MILRFSSPASKLSLSAAVTAALLMSNACFGASKFWDTDGATAGLQPGTGVWDTATTPEWSTTAAGTALTTWAADDDAFFQTAGANAVTLGGTVQALSVQQSVTGTATTISGGTALQIDGTTGFVNTGNTALVVNSDVVLNAATVAFSATADITMGGNITQIGGTRLISKTGAGILTLNGTNSFGTGTLTFGSGTTNVGAIRLGSSTGLGNYTTINLPGTNAAVDRIELSGSQTYAYNITTGGRSSQQGNGAALVNIAGNNTWNGNLTINNTGGGYGVRSDVNTLTLGGTLSNAVVNNGRTWELGGSGTVLVTGAITGSATAILGILKYGTGTLNINSSNNTYANGTTVNFGTLVASGTTGVLGTGNVTVVATAIKLTIQTGVVSAIADTATLSLAGGGTALVADVGFAELQAGVNEIVGGLLLNGIAQTPGTYGSSTSLATNQSDEYFSGSGILTVVPEPGSAAMVLGGFGTLLGWPRLRRRS